MIRTVIVDDESIIRNDIKGMLAAHADIEVVGMCGSVREAVLLIPRLNPDLLLLDVQLSDGYSFDIFKALPEMRTPVIFITAFDNHAIRAIRIGALDYLLKPLHDEELDEALEKVRKHQMMTTRDQLNVATEQLANKKEEAITTIALRSQKNVQVIALEQIMYCEGAGNYTVFHLANAKPVTVTRSLKEYEELLPKDQFIRSHQSFLINIKYINRYEREGSIRLHNNTEIPVSFRKKEAVMEALMRRK